MWFCDVFFLMIVGVLLMFSVTPPRHSNNPSEDLFTGIIMLAVMLPGTTVSIIPTKSSVWGVCVIVYHWVLSVIIVSIMALIQYPATCRVSLRAFLWIRDEQGRNWNPEGRKNEKVFCLGTLRILVLFLGGKLLVNLRFDETCCQHSGWTESNHIILDDSNRCCVEKGNKLVTK